MPRDRTPPGDELTKRLIARRDLKPVTVPGVGVAYRGPMASRALTALGARAMTVDRHVIVSEDFNPSRPQDAALLAHEQVHVQRGDGGGASHPIHEAEEIAARAAEHMVFHQMSAGPDMGEMDSAPAQVIQRAVRGGYGQGGSPQSGTGSQQDQGGPEAVYQALRARGLEREEIIVLLAENIDVQSRADEALSAQRGQSLIRSF